MAGIWEADDVGRLYRDLEAPAAVALCGAPSGNWRAADLCADGKIPELHPGSMPPRAEKYVHKLGKDQVRTGT